MRLFAAIALSTCLVAVLVLSVAASDSSTDLQTEATRLYYSGVAGNSSDLARSAELFDKLSRESFNSLNNAYRGSLTLMEAGRTLAFWKKSELSKRGLALLDNSVASEPANLEIRFVRAATTLHLPSFFQRSQQSCDDLRYIAPKATEAVAQNRLDPKIARAALKFYAAQCVDDRVLSSQDAIRQADQLEKYRH